MKAAGLGLVGRIALPLKVRVEIFYMLANMLEAGSAFEEALDIAVRIERAGKQFLRVWILRRWRKALEDNRFEEEVAIWVPSSEAMIFQAFRRVDAKVLLLAAARVAEMREKQLLALRNALAMPLFCMVLLVAMLWGAGGYLIKPFIGMSDPESWTGTTRLFNEVATWMHENILLFGAVIGGVVVVVVLITLLWIGPGRATLDRIPPFSIYRLVVGSAFVFVLLEYLAAGSDVNHRTFEQLKRSASPYTRDRIGALQRRVGLGASLGRAMQVSGHGFPAPELIPVIAGLERQAGWEIRLRGFVERWVGRSEQQFKSRTAALNYVLLTLVAVVVVLGIEGMVSMTVSMGGGQF